MFPFRNAKKKRLLFVLLLCMLWRHVFFIYTIHNRMFTLKKMCWVGNRCTFHLGWRRCSVLDFFLWKWEKKLKISLTYIYLWWFFVKVLTDFFFGIKCNTKKYVRACKCIDILGRKMRVNNARLSFGEIWVGREMTVAYLVFFYVSYFSILLWVFFLLSVALCVAFRFLKMKQQS